MGKKLALFACLILGLIGYRAFSKRAVEPSGIETALNDSKATPTNVKFSNDTLPDVKVPYTIITKMTPLFQADKSTTVFHLRGQTIDDPKRGLITKLWSNKAANSLEISWQDKSIKPQEQKRTQDGHGFSDVGETQKTTGSGIDIYFGYVKEKQCIGIDDVKDGEHKLLGVIPYNHPGKSAAHCFVAGDFPIGVLPQTYLGQLGGLASLILIDVPQAKLIGDIIPKELQHLSRPYFFADRTNNIILGVDFYLDWLIMIDFREYMKANKENFKIDHAK